MEKQLKNVYQPTGRIFKGGMSRVEETSNPETGERYAVKWLLPAARSSYAVREGFVHQVKYLSHEHPYTVRGKGYVVNEEGDEGLVMNFLDGPTIHQVINNGGLSVYGCADITAKVAVALQRLHNNGFVYRDMKPDNIKIDQEENPTLFDFDLMAFEGTEENNCAFGTPSYMAPEKLAAIDGGPQIHRVDKRSDIYSLGATMYAMITGQRPFTGKTPQDVFHNILHEPLCPPSALREGVPEDVDVVVGKMMERDISKRYQTMEEVIDDIAVVQKGRFMEMLTGTEEERPPDCFYLDVGESGPEILRRLLR